MSLSPAAQAIEDGQTLRRVIGSDLGAGDVVQIPRPTYERLMDALEEAVGALKTASRGSDSAQRCGISRRMMSAILSAVSDQCRVSVEQLKGRRRTVALVDARQIAMHLARKLPWHTLEEVGNEFCRDRTTVSDACRRIESILSMNDTNPKNVRLRADYKKIEEALSEAGGQP